MLACIGAKTQKQNGFDFRSFAQNNTKKALADDGYWVGTYDSCENYLDSRYTNLLMCAKDSRESPAAAIIGDSKAAALAGGLVRTSLPGRRWLMLTSKGGGDYTFLPIISKSSLYSFYKPEIPRAALDILHNDRNINTVVIAVATRHLFGLPIDTTLEELPETLHLNDVEIGLRGFVNELLKMDKNIVLVIDNPTLPNIEGCFERRTEFDFLNRLIIGHKKNECRLSWIEYVRRTKSYRNLLFRIAEMDSKKIKVFDQADMLCDSKSDCLVMAQGRPLYGFTDHISDFAAGIIGAQINKMIFKSN